MNYNIQLRGEEISNDEIDKIRFLIDSENDDESSQLFQTDREKDDFKAVLFNHLFKRLKKILYRPVSSRYNETHWEETVQVIKDSKIINELEEYGYNDPDFERIKDDFKNTKRKRHHEHEEDVKSRRPDSDFTIYGDDRV